MTVYWWWRRDVETRHATSFLQTTKKLQKIRANQLNPSNPCIPQTKLCHFAKKTTKRNPFFFADLKKNCNFAFVLRQNAITHKIYW